MTCALAMACGSERSRAGTPDLAAARELSTDASARNPSANGPGKLAPSTQRVSWVALPTGFQPQPGSTPASATFHAQDVPLSKVTDYFEERLVPGSIDLRTNGVVYRNAKPKHTQLPLPPVNVTVLEVDRSKHVVRVVVDDLSPPSEPPLRVDVAARELDRERNAIE